MNFEKLSEQVLEWADDKGILVPENRFKQALKMVSEVGELCDAVIKGNEAEQTDSIGDVLVTVIILAEQLGKDPVKCLEVAYNVIKNRTGKTVNGIFVKNESLKVGDKLIAIDPCEIKTTCQECLNVGSSYEIVRVSDYGIEILNKHGHSHSFTHDEVKEFFK